MTPSSYTLWHTRLGHPNAHVLKLVLNHCNIALFNTPLELIFIDLWGPSHITSHSGYTYYVFFIDVYSKFTWIYPLKSKSKTLFVFQQFKTMVELQLNHKIKNVQSDWGGEYKPFTTFLSNHGITHRLICPHTHHQNGVVERKHRHIVELGLTLLHHPFLPLAF